MLRPPPNDLSLRAGFSKGKRPKSMIGYSIVFWFWLGERSGASERSGTLCVSPFGDTLIAKQSINHQVSLELNGVATEMVWPADDWHLVSIVH